MNGGITTTLAFILLADSRSHVFTSFFKIFFLVVTFGLFHGLVVLPVFLSLLGPQAVTLGSAPSSEAFETPPKNVDEDVEKRQEEDQESIPEEPIDSARKVTKNGHAPVGTLPGETD